MTDRRSDGHGSLPNVVHLPPVEMPRVTDGVSFRWTHTNARPSHAVFQPTVAAGVAAARAPGPAILVTKDVAEDR